MMWAYPLGWVADVPPPKPPPEVELYTSPRVSGTSARNYFGPVAVEAFTEDQDIESRDKALQDLLQALIDKARALGANAIVGVEVFLDPFAEREGGTGLSLRACGTAAHLVPLL